jgi:hypothetical protein
MKVPDTPSPLLAKTVSSQKQGKCPTCGGKHNPKLSCLKAWLRDVKGGKRSEDPMTDVMATMAEGRKARRSRRKGSGMREAMMGTPVSTIRANPYCRGNRLKSSVNTVMGTPGSYQKRRAQK